MMVISDLTPIISLIKISCFPVLYDGPVIILMINLNLVVAS